MWRQRDFDIALVGIARVGLDGRWLDINPALCRLLGQRKEDIEKLRFQDVTHPDDLEQDVSQVNRLISQGHGSYSMVKRYLRPNGEWFWANLDVSLSLDSQGRPDYFVSIIQDFSSTKQELDRLHHVASHDRLTGLPNREMFETMLSDSITFARRTGQGFTLAYIDLDGFKEINDTMGHLVGDELLAQISTRLKANVRKADFSARLGGDEFAVILQNIASLHDQERAIAHINRCFEREFVLSGKPVRLTASIGTARYPSDGDGMTALIAAADKNMYAAKRQRYTALGAHGTGPRSRLHIKQPSILLPDAPARVIRR